jgi:putative cell wall-binding protein
MTVQGIRKSRAISLALVATMFFAAGSLSAVPASAATPIATPPVSGILTWSSDGSPVVGGVVSVSLSCGPGVAATSTSDEQGHYAVPAGYLAEPCRSEVFPVVVSATGDAGSKSIAQSVMLYSGSGSDLVADFSLERHFELTGRVTDALSGEPLSDVTVSAYAYCPDGCPYLPERHTTTDVNGHYGLLLPTWGSADLEVSVPATFVRPSVGNFPVPEGGSGVQDFVADRYGVITGIVTNAAEPPKPLAGIRVGSVTTDATGRYSVLANSYSFQHDGFRAIFDVIDPIGDYAQVHEDLGAAFNSSVNHDIVLDFGGSISGTVTGVPAGSTVPVPLEDASVYLSGTGPAVGASTRTDSLGRYSLEHVGSGTYTVNFWKEQYARVQWNNIPTGAAGTPVVVRPGEPVSGINAELPVAASLAGDVELEGGSAEQLLGTLVTLMPVGATTGAEYPLKSTLPGRYVYWDLLPGDYILRYEPSRPGYHTTYSGGTIDPSRAEIITIAAGDSIELPPVTIRKIAPPTDTSRVAGEDRYSGAVEVSKKAYPSGADVVYVVTGENYPDALSAAPAAVVDHAPLLLTQTATLPTSVENEVRRLDPDRIVVVGGPNSVSAGVLAQLKSIVSDTVRVGGADRYEASRNVAEYAFGDGTERAYVATGTNFPDALSAGAAAGSKGAPVVLVYGEASAVDAATATLLDGLGVTAITVAGGPNSVSNGLASSLNAIAPTTRQAGADRFAASAAINLEAFPFSNEAFVVTGLKFPDALVGSSWAGAIGAPLYVSHQDCVTAEALAAMANQGVMHVTLIGGRDSLSSAVADLDRC